MKDEKNNLISNFGSLKPKLIDNITLLNKVNDNLPTCPPISTRSLIQAEKKQKLCLSYKIYSSDSIFDTSLQTSAHMHFFYKIFYC